jgi:hypothetical protein
MVGFLPLIPGVDPSPYIVYCVDEKLALRLIFPIELRYACVSIIPITLSSRLQANGIYGSQAGEGCILGNKEIAFNISGSLDRKIFSHCLDGI